MTKQIYDYDNCLVFNDLRPYWFLTHTNTTRMKLDRSQYILILQSAHFSTHYLFSMSLNSLPTSLPLLYSIYFSSLPQSFLHASETLSPKYPKDRDWNYKVLTALSCNYYSGAVCYPTALSSHFRCISRLMTPANRWHNLEASVLNLTTKCNTRNLLAGETWSRKKGFQICLEAGQILSEKQVLNSLIS